jgi:hypothetical protein
MDLVLFDALVVFIFGARVRIGMTSMVGKMRDSWEQSPPENQPDINQYFLRKLGLSEISVRQRSMLFCS